MVTAATGFWWTAFGGRPFDETWGGRLLEGAVRSRLAGASPPDSWLAVRQISARTLILLLGEVPSVSGFSCTFGGRSLAHLGGAADFRDLRERRRLFLINKRFHSPQGLSAAEDEELSLLQADFEAYLDAIRPLPDRMLEELEALAEGLEAEDRRP